MLPKKAIIPFLFSILILSSYSCLLTTRRVAADVAFPTFSITPAASEVAVGENTTVNVMISNVYNLFIYQVYISYSPNVLSLVDIEEGELLRRNGACQTFWQTLNDTGGLVKVVNSLLKGGQTVTGEGAAFNVTFTALRPGGSELLLHHTFMTNQYGGSMAPILTQNGTMSTTGIKVTPNSLRPSGSNDYSVNKTFDINITLDGAVSQLYGYKLNVSYGKDVLEATAATLLPTLGTPNTNQTIIDNNNGSIELSLNCTPPAPSTNVTGVLVTVTFRVINVGGTSIEISESSTLTDKDGLPLFPLLGSASFDNRYANRNIGIVSSLLSSYQITAGDNITGAIIVRNDESVNETYTILVKAYGTQDNGQAIIGGPTSLVIGANTTDTINVTLATTGLAGNYTIKASIYYLPEETDLLDNSYNVTNELLVHQAEESQSPFSTTVYVAIALVVILIAVVAIYILRRR